LGGQLRSRFPAEQLGWPIQGAGFGGPLPPLQINGFADGDDGEQPPQVGAVIQLSEATLLGPQAEAFEGAQGDVFVVPGQCGDALEPGARQADQPPEVNLQQPLHGGVLAVLELGDPECPLVGGRHWGGPASDVVVDCSRPQRSPHPPFAARRTGREKKLDMPVGFSGPRAMYPVEGPGRAVISRIPEKGTECPAVRATAAQPAWPSSRWRGGGGPPRW